MGVTTLSSLYFIALTTAATTYGMETRYGDSADNTVEENSSIFSLIRMSWLGAVSKGMRAIKFCSDTILQVLTRGVG